MEAQYLVHLMLKCNSCPWSTEDHINGKDKAQEHANETGHSVSGEAGYGITINGE